MTERTTIHGAFWRWESAAAWVLARKAEGFDTLSLGLTRTGLLRRYHMTMQGPRTRRGPLSGE